MSNNTWNVTIKQAEEIILGAIEYNNHLAENPIKGWRDRIVLQLIGDPGIGKTAMSKSAAKKAGVEFYSRCLTQMDPIVIGGMQFFDEAAREMYTNKPDWLKTEGKWLILFDEWAQCSLMAKNIMGEALNEHKMGPYQLSDCATLMLASNPASAKAGTTATPSQIRDRTTDLFIQPDFKEWVEMAKANGVHPMVTAYLQFAQAEWNNFDPALDKNATQRSWTKVSEIIKMGLSQYGEMACIAGQIGAGPAGAFQGFRQVYQDLPRPESIVNDPDNAPIFGTDRPDLLYAVIGMLSVYMNRKNIGAILQYAARMPGEWGMLLMKDAFTRDKTLTATKEGTKWLATNGRDLILGE